MGRLKPTRSEVEAVMKRRQHIPVHDPGHVTVTVANDLGSRDVESQTGAGRYHTGVRSWMSLTNRSLVREYDKHACNARSSR